MAQSQYIPDLADIQAVRLRAANNLSDVASPAAAFSNIKQPATEAASGVLPIATAAQALAFTDGARAIVPTTLRAAGAVFTAAADLQLASALSSLGADFGSLLEYLYIYGLVDL